MKKLGIGGFIAARRKEKGLTQEDLADYLGVSKPAVSKWESGQTYPDIMLLPVLAAFFNTTVDALLGYEAQMTKAEIRRLYERMSAAFASEPFEKVRSECREYVRKYHACWNLLYSVALLLVNNAALAGGTEAALEVLREACALLENVEKESCDAKLSRDALSLRAYCFLALGEPSEAIDLLGDEDSQPLSTEILLAKAYSLRGDRDRARGLLQRFVFTSGAGVVAAMTDMMALYADDSVKLEESLALAEKVGAAFDLKRTQPHHYFTLYLTAASLFAAKDRHGRALELLEAYTDLVTDPGTYPLKLRGNAYFDLLEPYYDALAPGNTPPRSEKLIKRDMRDAVLRNPAFFCLEEDARFRRLAARLEKME